MEFTVKLEKPSHILRKLTVSVSAKTVENRLERGLVEVQKTAKIKGFRPGHVPLSVVKQYYGDDVRHQVFHNLIEESFKEAVQKENLKTVGSPRIETPEHKTGEGTHDHAVQEGKELTYTATVEVLPEIDVKHYAGFSLTKDRVEVTDKDVDQVINGLLDSQAQLISASGGLANADGTQSSRAAQKGDFIDITFNGGLVTETGVEEKPGMKGTRVVEIGSDSLIPGFEQNLIDMRKAETKTFRIPFPKNYPDKEMAGKKAEFTVTINEVKEKKLPELNDEFAKQVGYESLEDMKKKAREHLIVEKTNDSDRKLRSDLLQELIEKNKFEVPGALIQAQTKALAQDVAGNLKQQGFNEQMIQEALSTELENLKKRAENQVRASLLLDTIAKKENIEVKSEEIDSEIKKIAQSMNTDESKIREYYEKNSNRREDLIFRMKEEASVKFLLSKSKIKEK